MPRARSDSSIAWADASTECAGRQTSCSASMNASGSSTPRLPQDVRVAPVAVVAAEHRLPPPRRELGVVVPEPRPVAGLDELVVPLEIDERVVPVEEDRVDHATLR